MPVWQSITESELVLCSHEQEASYVAVGYGKMKKSLPVVISIGGPGVTNCISGLASANIDSVPLLYISGRTPIGKDGCGLRQEESHYNRKFDSIDMTKTVSKTSICIDNVNTAAASIINAFETAIARRNGCVHLSIPIDLQKEEIPLNYPIWHNREYQDTGKMINFKKRPMIIIGWGCWMSQSVGNVYKLAEKINAPVLVTSKAYCCIKYRHPLFAGKLGYGFTELLEDFITSYNSDQFLVFGSSMGEKDIPPGLCNLINSSELYVWTVEDDSILRRFPNAHILTTANMAQNVSALTDFVEGRPENTELYASINDRKKAIHNFWQSRIKSTDYMAHMIADICELPGNVVITADAGNHLLDLGALNEPDEVGKCFIDVGIRSMGSGICSTVGMAIADPAQTYVAITGDGCMLMNGNVMHLAYNYKLPVIFVVFNNFSLGRVRVGQSVMNDYRATDIYNVDFGMYAQAFGLAAYKFNTPEAFRAHIGEIILKREPALVEVFTDHDEIPVTLKDNVY